MPQDLTLLSELAIPIQATSSAYHTYSMKMAQTLAYLQEQATSLKPTSPSSSFSRLLSAHIHRANPIHKRPRSRWQHIKYGVHFNSWPLHRRVMSLGYLWWSALESSANFANSELWISMLDIDFAVQERAIDPMDDMGRELAVQCSIYHPSINIGRSTEYDLAALPYCSLL